MPRRIGNRQAPCQVFQQEQGPVADEPPARRLDIVDARRQPGLGEQLFEQGAIEHGHQPRKSLAKRCSRCNGFAPAFSACLRLGLLTSAIQVPPSSA